MDLSPLLRWYLDMGCDTLWDAKVGPQELCDTAVDNNSRMVDGIQGVCSSRELVERCSTLDELEKIVKLFKECDICKTAINTVFGDGNPDADVMLIGEAPGAKEDEMGIPFCGPSGKLLDNIMMSIGMKRSDVYITNTVFWRPPGNRRPTPEEVAKCRPFVEKHIELIAPKIIILVGSTAVESLLGTKETMHNLRGNVFEYSNQYLKNVVKCVVIFHPSYLLRQPLKKKLMWHDVSKISELLDQG